MAEHPRFRSKYDPMAMVKPNETEAQFMLTDVLRIMLWEAEQREAERNGLSDIERSKRWLLRACCSRWEAPTTLFDSTQSDLSVTGADIICNEEFPITSKGTGVVCTDKAGIHSHGYTSSFLPVLYAPWTCVKLNTLNKMLYDWSASR